MQQYIYLEQSLPSHAVRYAIDMALMPFSEPNLINHQLNGLPYFLSLRKIVKSKEAFASLLTNLTAIKMIFFHKMAAL